MKRYKVRLAGHARADLREIKAWLTQPGSGQRAARRYAAILEAVIDLETNPLRWPRGDHPALRERPTQAHRVIYQVFENSGRVEVLRIFGPYQNRSRL